MTPKPKAKAASKRINLTDRSIAAIKTPGVVHDKQVPHLQLRVRDTGVKTWSMVYRLRGEQKRLTFGPYPSISLADARQRAKDARRDIEDGIDPAVEKQQRREADTFGDLALDYIEKHAKKKKRSWKEDQRMLNADVLPYWKDRLARDITRRDVRDLVERIAEGTKERKSAPILANRVTALLSKVFTFACTRDIIDASPMVGVERPAPEKARERVLSDDEIRAFWVTTVTAAEFVKTPALRAFWQLRLLTAQRGKEVAAMRWQDVNIEDKAWTIPATIAKNGRTHMVPLSEPVVALLNELPRDDEYALHGARGKRQQRLSAKAFTIADFRGHDLRRTASTRMRAAGISQFDVSRVLNHAAEGVTAKHYDHYDNLAEKRNALDTWARKLEGILKNKPAEVLPFAPKGDVIRPDADIANADWPKRTPDVDVDGTAVR